MDVLVIVVTLTVLTLSYLDEEVAWNIRQEENQKKEKYCHHLVEDFHRFLCHPIKTILNHPFLLFALLVLLGGIVDSLIIDCFQPEFLVHEFALSDPKNKIAIKTAICKALMIFLFFLIQIISLYVLYCDLSQSTKMKKKKEKPSIQNEDPLGQQNLIQINRKTVAIFIQIIFISALFWNGILLSSINKDPFALVKLVAGAI